MPIALANYFSDLAPKQKREREQKYFKELTNQFEIVQVDRALEFLQRNGALEDGASVHSPMAYLSLSIRDVLAKVKTEDETQERRRRSERQQQLEQEEKARNDAREAEEAQRRELTFCGVFPNPERQEEVIREMCKKHQFGLKPEGKIARCLAIQSWWDALSGDERKSLGLYEAAARN